MFHNLFDIFKENFGDMNFLHYNAKKEKLQTSSPMCKRKSISLWSNKYFKNFDTLNNDKD